MIAVDSNIIAYLFLGLAHGRAAEALLRSDQDWVAPRLWRSEFRNVLAGCLRRRELDSTQARAIQFEAEDFMAGGEYEVDSAAVLDLITRSDCSAYDCEYVVLAKQLGVGLVTADKRILHAFPEVAVPFPAE